VLTINKIFSLQNYSNIINVNWEISRGWDIGRCNSGYKYEKEMGKKRDNLSLKG
jgi:hypothetical protein